MQVFYLIQSLDGVGDAPADDAGDIDRGVIFGDALARCGVENLLRQLNELSFFVGALPVVHSLGFLQEGNAHVQAAGFDRYRLAEHFQNDAVILRYGEDEHGCCLCELKDVWWGVNPAFLPIRRANEAFCSLKLYAFLFCLQAKYRAQGPMLCFS